MHGPSQYRKKRSKSVVLTFIISTIFYLFCYRLYLAVYQLVTAGNCGGKSDVILTALALTIDETNRMIWRTMHVRISGTANNVLISFSH